MGEQQDPPGRDQHPTAHGLKMGATPPVTETRKRGIDPGTLAAFVPGEQQICPAVLAGRALSSGCQLEEASGPFVECVLHPLTTLVHALVV
ncbi:hypothetical protein FQN60_004957 [Etheostoma spectabile]|uniref:Uncharacterized protein n=1 Tax=Etheostoma spectabile TaxID=54343 RepID=A0A5J5DLN4_9PERO|nr:hypothetical protein FQN60_004957 [Etheostoma spectabile]